MEDFSKGNFLLKGNPFEENMIKQILHRKAGTDPIGSDFQFETRWAVWSKGLEIPGVDPNRFRMDRYGSMIAWSQYGKVAINGTGWEIDHIFPVSKGGSDALANLQPLQWLNNRRKGDQVRFNQVRLMLTKR